LPGGPLRARLRFIILLLLATRPLHGYAIMEEVYRLTEGTLRPSPGTLYPELRRLAEEGLVRERIEKGERSVRRVYEITEEGLKRLHESLEEFMNVTATLVELSLKAQERIHRDLHRDRGRDECHERVERLAARLSSILSAWGGRVEP